MTLISSKLAALPISTVRGMARGIEKESLRVLAQGSLALTPHPAGLGSALTHPLITTDFSESQIELITGVHGTVEDCVAQMVEIHQSVYRNIEDELLWVSSMPCGLPTDETIPLARYGASNVGRAKSVYRMGLGLRYGRRMQTISGIHYNWSLPGLGTDDYFALIRNFRRQVFLLMLLFGASPAVCKTFVSGRQHGLQALGTGGTLHLPYATSLRMGKLGYQSDAQASIAASFNSLESYGASLQEALTRPYAQYETIGVRNPGGDYNQLATTLLQIENEYYGTIRPKRTIRRGERPLHALRERGVEYVEVRCLDLNPFLPVGINADTMRFIDMFLLHCLLKESPLDSVDDIGALSRNQQRVASQGRDPGLMLERNGDDILLSTWALEIIDECRPIAAMLDATFDGKAYSENLDQMAAAVENPSRLPSSRVLASISDRFNNSYIQFALAQSQAAREHILSLPFVATDIQRYKALAARSVVEQKEIEAADVFSFEDYRAHYVSPKHLELTANFQ
jgi:glutamate--cysteine ligase